MAKKSTKLSLREVEEWFMSSRPLYESLTSIVCGTLEGLIKESKIAYLSVSGRTKSRESFSDKIRRKRYQNPKQDISDLSGIRVIVYIESDASSVTDLVKSSFRVHSDKSLDKTSELGIDKAGYRSIHLVCDLGPERKKLPEYEPYSEMLFEVQVRTVLQHAWAEIEHDRNYKFSGVLPEHLQRRLYLAAGTLEMVDREFDALSAAVDEYGAAVAEKAKKGDFDIPINSTSIHEYLQAKYKENPNIHLDSFSDQNVMEELKAFGINSISDLQSLLESDSMRKFDIIREENTGVGLVRNAMILNDIDRYFKQCWNKHWKYTMLHSIAIWSKKYGETKINKVLSTYGIEIDESMSIEDLLD